MSAENILSLRRVAALKSKGTSHDVLYQKVEDEIQKLSSNLQVLDFGAGVGKLTRQLMANSKIKNVSAVDLMGCPSDLVDRMNWRTQDLNDALPSDWHQTFDLVIALEVIEHLENPRLLFREFKKILKPGGTLILSTPNNESLRALLNLFLRGHYIGFSDSEYPAHITALLRKDFERISAESQFGHPDFFYSERGMIPKMKLTWQQVSFGFLSGRLFSDNLILKVSSSQ